MKLTQKGKTFIQPSILINNFITYFFLITSLQINYYYFLVLRVKLMIKKKEIKKEA